MNFIDLYNNAVRVHYRTSQNTPTRALVNDEGCRMITELTREDVGSIMFKKLIKPAQECLTSKEIIDTVQGLFAVTWELDNTSKEPIRVT